MSLVKHSRSNSIDNPPMGSPLQMLRHSSDDFNIARDYIRQSTPVSEKSGPKTKRRSVLSHINDGFEIDSVAPRRQTTSSPQSNLASDDTLNSNSNSLSNGGSSNVRRRESLKRVGELASLFLDMKKTIMIDSNVDPNLVPQNSIRQPPTDKKAIRVSKATLIRSERVKAMLSLYYLSIERLHQWKEHNNAVHVGVEDVFNPLQVIRNRKIRKKYHEFAKPLSFKTVPLASQVFSHKDRKLIWQVEYHELMNDFVWRMNHWNELTDAKGDLWFPSPVTYNTRGEEYEDAEENGLKTSNELRHDKQREMEERDDSVYLQVQSPFKHPSLTRTSSSTDEESRHHGRRTSTLSSNDRSRSTSRIRNAVSSKKSKMLTPSKFFKRSNNSGSSSPSIKNDYDEYFEDDSFDFNPTTNVNHTTSNPSNGNGISKFRFPGKDDSISPPVFKISTMNDEISNALNNISIEPLDHRRNVSSVSSNRNNASSTNLAISTSNNTTSSVSEFHQLGEPFHSKGESSTSSSGENSQEDLEIYSYMKKLNQIETQMNVVCHSLYIKPSMIRKFILKNNAEATISSINSLCDIIESELLPNHRILFESYNREIESFKTDLLNNQSSRIDSLLFLSDRAVSEINTSLALELRKLNERIEKLDAVHIGSDGLSKFGYKLLENMIVFLLWTAWGIVTIYKFFRFFVRLFFGLFKLVIGT